VGRSSACERSRVQVGRRASDPPIARRRWSRTARA
jgi:hypothetical protein